MPAPPTARSPPGLAGQMAADALGGFTDPRPAPSQFTMTSVMDHAAWEELVARAVARIDDGALGKVVLARQVDVTANRPFVTSDVLSRLLALYPTCMIFRVDGFIGASPELLIERRGAHVASHPLPAPLAAAAIWPPMRRSLPGFLPRPRSAGSTPTSSKVSAAAWARSARAWTCPANPRCSNCATCLTWPPA